LGSACRKRRGARWKSWRPAARRPRDWRAVLGSFWRLRQVWRTRQSWRLRGGFGKWRWRFAAFRGAAPDRRRGDCGDHRPDFGRDAARIPDVHLVMGNDATHKTPAIQRWHPDRRLLAQPGRALLRRPDRKSGPARGPSLDPGTRTGRPRPYRHRQRQFQTLSLDQVGRRHPRHHQTLLSAHPGYRRTPEENQQNFGIRTLGSFLSFIGSYGRFHHWCIRGAAFRLNPDGFLGPS